jgi:hypothetical protein
MGWDAPDPSPWADVLPTWDAPDPSRWPAPDAAGWDGPLPVWGAPDPSPWDVVSVNMPSRTQKTGRRDNGTASRGGGR